MHKPRNHHKMLDRHVVGLLLLMAGICSSAGIVWGADRNPSHAPSPETSPADGPASYVGVIGAVEKPGVYEIPAGSPDINDLIRQAGGLTAAASGNLRIVRNGRLARQIFYSGQLNLKVFSGDVVAIDSRSVYPPGSQAVQLALTGLIDRPVVVRMRPHQATLEQLAHFLGQPPETISTIRVLQPRSWSQGDANTSQPDNGTLPSGTVLVFDPAVVHPDTIPPLPGVYRVADPQKHSAAAQPEEPQNVSPAILPDGFIPRLPIWTEPDASPAEVGARPSAPGRSAPATGQNEPATGQRTPRGPIVQPPPWNRRLTSLSPSTAVLAEQADEPDDLSDADSSETFERKEPRIEPGAKAAGSDTAPSAVAMRDDTTDTSKRLDTPTIGQSDSSPSATVRSSDSPMAPLPHPASVIARLSSLTDVRGLVIGGVATLIVLASLILLILMSRRSHRSPVAPSRAARGSSLEALIQNTLPLVEQPLHLPPHLQFYGSPGGQRRIRLDAAHQFNTPNFHPTDPTFQPVDRPDGLPPAIPPRHHQDDVGRGVAEGTAHGPIDVKRPYSLKKQTDRPRPVFTADQGVTER